MKQGIFIVFEGIDGAGKTTQIQRLGDVLTDAGEQVVLSREPTDGVWGRRIRESATTGRMSLDDELAAFIEDRKEHIQQLIAPSLLSGKVVILDRYFYSTIAYQGARGADPEQLTERMLSFAPEPDMVFLFDMDPTISVQRISQMRGEVPNEFEQREYLESVRGIFNGLAQTRNNIWTLDSSCSIDEIHQTIVALLVENVLRSKRSSMEPSSEASPHSDQPASIPCDWTRMKAGIQPIPPPWPALIAEPAKR